jgi:hypothetical protein
VNARRIFGRPWAEIPLPLRLNLGLAVLAVPISVAHLLASDRPLLALGAPFGLVFTALLLRGWRWLWVLFVFGAIAGLVLPPYHYDLDPWWGYIHASDIVDLVLLLWPSTRRFVWSKRPEAIEPAPGNAGDGVELADSERPDGWYLDPVNPMRMRYWHGETGAWLGGAKTPRKTAQEAGIGSTAALVPGPKQTSRDLTGYTDADRPRGWYVDPEDPGRMLHWTGEETGWLGPAKTPRKVRRAWEAERGDLDAD